MIEDDLRSSFPEGCFQYELTLLKCSFNGVISTYMVCIMKVLNYIPS